MIACVGVGLHSSARVGITLRPASAGTGIRFRRVDRLGSAAVPARLDHVVELGIVEPGPLELGEATCLGAQPASCVRMIDHLMAALLVCEIDNVLIEISGPELPVMDGSAQPFVLLIECAGVQEQAAPVTEIEILEPVEVTEGRGHARIEPQDALWLEVRAAEASRSLSLCVTPEACKSELVAARAAGAPARFADEISRHAALRTLADLALIPARLRGRMISHRADARLRRRLLRSLLARPQSWRLHGELPGGLLLGASPAGTGVLHPDRGRSRLG